MSRRPLRFLPGPSSLAERNPQNSERHTRLRRTERRSQYSRREGGGSGRESRSPEQMRWGTKLTRLERAELRDAFLKTVF